MYRLRPYVELFLSFLPFGFVMKMVDVLLSSQGFGSGAQVRTSGELNAARIVLGDDVHHAGNRVGAVDGRGDPRRRCIPVSFVLRSVCARAR